MLDGNVGVRQSFRGILGIVPKEIGASANAIFGSPSVSSLFLAGQSATATSTQEIARVTIKATTREINRLRGYKIELTPFDKNRLVELQGKVEAIERKAANGTVRADELDDRLDMLAEADRIIGKPIVDLEVDETLAELGGLVEALLNPKLTPALTKRVEFLERMKDAIEESVNNNPGSDTLRVQFQNLTAQIDQIMVPRAISTLSLAERKAYDDLTELINDHAGAKVQLSSREAIRVATLENSVFNLTQLLGPDASQ